jgi:ribokinase
MQKKPKILVVGSFVMDLIVSTSRVPNEGETVIAGLDFKTASGGKGANQAVQAAKLGADVTFVGKVGNDSFGKEMVAAVSAAGVNTEFVLKDKKVSSGVGNIIIDCKPGQKAKNRIIVVPGANMAITPDEIAFLEDTIKNYDMVMLQLEIPMEINEIVASYAFNAGVPVMLNSAPSAPLSPELLNKLTYISPNEHEAADLTNIPITKKDGILDIDSVKKAAAKLLEMGVKNVIITLGSNGVAFMNSETFIYKPCVDIVEVVDPTAAGDSFVGAFCTAVASGKNYDEALDYANYTATLTVSRMGAQPSLPSNEEVEELIDTHKKQLQKEN